MPKYFRRGRRATRRTRRSAYRKRTSRSRYPSRGIKSRIAKLEKVAIKERPSKRWFISDQGAGGGVGNLSGFASSILADTNPILEPWGYMSRGTSLQTRVADDVYWSKIQVKCVSTATLSSQCDVHWILAVKNETDGAAVTTTSFVQDYFGVSSNPAINSIPNLVERNTRSKYRILKKGRFKFNPQSANQFCKHEFMINWFSKRHVHTSFARSNTASEVDVDSGQIFLFMMTDSQLTSASGIKTSMEGNMWFRDQV